MHQFKTNDHIYTIRDTQSIALYLSDICHEPRVSIEEEVELSKQIRKGGPEAQKAKDRLVRANLRFVISVAKAYQHTGMELADLINEGNIGLMTAADRFDHSRGFKFVSYAVWWIRQAITQALCEYGRMVRMPVNQLNMLNRIERMFNKIQLEEGRQPSDEEVANAIGLPTHQVQKLHSLDVSTSSIDAPLSDDSDSTVGDMMTAPDSPDTDAQLMRESLRKELECNMNILPERERRVLTMFFGLNGHEMSCGEIGTRLNLTSERVRQLKERALRRMRDRMLRHP